MDHVFLTEQLAPKEAALVESRSNGDVFLEGIIMQADIRNGNGRVYPKELLEKAVKKMQKQIAKTGVVLGELDHPQGLTVNLQNVSHALVEVRMEGSNVIGKLKLLDTPMGKIAKELAGITSPGVSSRGAGKLNENGIVEEFDVVTVDLVYNQSAPDAMLKTVYESVDLRLKEKDVSLSEHIKGDAELQKILKEKYLAVLDALTEESTAVFGKAEPFAKDLRAKLNALGFKPRPMMKAFVLRGKLDDKARDGLKGEIEKMSKEGFDIIVDYDEDSGITKVSLKK